MPHSELRSIARVMGCDANAQLWARRASAVGQPPKKILAPRKFKPADLAEAGFYAERGLTAVAGGEDIKLPDEFSSAEIWVLLFCPTKRSISCRALHVRAVARFSG